MCLWRSQLKRQENPDGSWQCPDCARKLFQCRICGELGPLGAPEGKRRRRHPNGSGLMMHGEEDDEEGDEEGSDEGSDVGRCVLPATASLSLSSTFLLRTSRERD